MTDIERILTHDADDHGRLADRVSALADETALWALMDDYNWDDGFEVPLAVVRHLRCDRALALRLFWELDDSAREFHDEQTPLGSTFAPYDAEEARRVDDYCRTLVDGLREERFPTGRNTFDTGFFHLDDPALTERQRKLRAAKTTRTQRDYADGFIRPVL
ncbi:DUF4274 domain-containing protein [Rhodococcus triatomae]